MDANKNETDKREFRFPADDDKIYEILVKVTRHSAWSIVIMYIKHKQVLQFYILSLRLYIVAQTLRPVANDKISSYILHAS